MIVCDCKDKKLQYTIQEKTVHGSEQECPFFQTMEKTKQSSEKWNGLPLTKKLPCFFEFFRECVYIMHKT